MPEPESISIVIADDHPIFRRGLRDIIEEDPRFIVLAECGDGGEAVVQCHRLRPRIAILDIEMPRMGGLETAQALRALPLPPLVMFLSMHDSHDVIHRAMKTGALGFILKDDAAREILSGLEQVATGQRYISASLSNRLSAGAPKHEPDAESALALSLLTAAERRVLRLIAENRTTEEIGEALAISPRTVEGHRSHIARKLGLKGSYALVRYALVHRESL